MAGKTILITGATSGIGLELFEQYTARGDNVIACGRDPAKLALLSNPLLDSADKTCLFDLNNPDDIEQQLAEIAPLDMVILNAGDCRYIDDAKHFDGKLFADIISTNRNG